MRRFHVSFVVSLNKQSDKPSICRWLETTQTFIVTTISSNPRILQTIFSFSNPNVYRNNEWTRVVDCLFTQMNVILVRHNSTYIILFLAWCNGPIDDEETDELHTSAPCPDHDVTIDCTMHYGTRQLFSGHVERFTCINSLDIVCVHGDIHEYHRECKRSCKKNILAMLSCVLYTNICIYIRTQTDIPRNGWMDTGALNKIPDKTLWLARRTSETGMISNTENIMNYHWKCIPEIWSWETQRRKFQTQLITSPCVANPLNQWDLNLMIQPETPRANWWSWVSKLFHNCWWKMN